MNAMLQRHCARYKYVVPEGLRELMSDISRGVLRSQPENTYAFIADYLDALMITRENARVAARLVQSITEIGTATVEFLQNTGMDRSEADHVVDIIQRTFKKHIEVQPYEPQPEDVEEANIISNIIDEANICPEKAEEAAIIIQRAFRSFKLRRDKERELLCGMIDWRIAARSAIQLYRKTGVTNEEAKRAATLIKAAYKGYYTRRVLRKLAAESKYLHEGRLEQVEEEERASSEEHLEIRAVSINYETVIPHVDFDESLTIEPHREESTATVIVAHVIQGILETVIPESEVCGDKVSEFEIQYEPSSHTPVDELHEISHHEVAEAVEHEGEAPLESQEPTEGQPIEAAEAAEGAHAAEAEHPAEETQPAEGEHPAETEQAAEAAPPAEAEQPAEEAPPAETEQPAEAAEPAAATESPEATTEEPPAEPTE